MLCIVAALFGVQYRAIIAAEEQFLRRRFGAAYDAWCARVPRFWPRFAPAGSPRPWDWRRALRKEHNPAAAWIAIAIVLVARDTLIEAWASLKSFKRKDEKPGDRPPPDDPGNPTVDFHGEKRSNETHESKTDPEARMARKGNGKEAKLSYSQQALMENRNGLLVEIQIAPATGTAERDTAIKMIDEHLPGTKRITLAGDKGYDTRGFVENCQERNVTPHVAKNEGPRRSSAIDGRTTRHPGYSISQVIRKRVEEIFGWTKTVANFRKTRFRGLERTQLASYLVGAAYNLMRIGKLLTAAAA